MIKRNIYLLWGIALLQGMVFYAPVATLYRQAAGLGIFHITLIESISLWVTISLEIPWGWAADRIGYRKTMLVCCFLYFISKVIFWQAGGFGGFLLERLLLSVVCAGLSGVDSSLLYVSCGGEDSHRVFSVYENLGQFGLLLAAAVYAVWVGENYRLAAMLTVVSYGIAAGLTLGLREVLPETDVSRKVAPKKLAAVWKTQMGNPKILLLLLAMGLFNETHQTITVFLSQLQYARVGMGHRAMTFAYILVNLMALVGVFSAAICTRIGAAPMGTGLLLLGALSCLLLGLFPWPVLSVLAVILLRMSFTLMQPLHMELQNRRITGPDRAAALSMNAVVMDSLGIFLNLAYGRVAEIRLDAAFLLGAVFCGAGALLYRCSFSQKE